MNKIPIQTTRFEQPTRVCIEASIEAIMAADLDTAEGEQFDYIDACISMEVNELDGEVSFTTVRTHKAWMMGVPSAGRGVWIIPRPMLEAVHI
jgi:hypothetical protein